MTAAVGDGHRQAFTFAEDAATIVEQPNEAVGVSGKKVELLVSIPIRCPDGVLADSIAGLKLFSERSGAVIAHELRKFVAEKSSKIAWSVRISATATANDCRRLLRGCQAADSDAAEVRAAFARQRELVSARTA